MRQKIPLVIASLLVVVSCIASGFTHATSPQNTACVTSCQPHGNAEAPSNTKQLHDYEQEPSPPPYSWPVLAIALSLLYLAVTFRQQPLTKGNRLFLPIALLRV